MSNIYLKVTNWEKKWCSQNFNFVSLICHQVSFFGSSLFNYKNSFNCNLKFRGLVARKTACGFCIILILRNYDVLKSNSPCIFLNKKDKLIKMKWTWKWIPHTIAEIIFLTFVFYLNDWLHFQNMHTFTY